MKKLICLFLMSWLPFFMGSAWSMNMQMEFKDQLTHASDLIQMPLHCHMNMSQSQQSKKDIYKSEHPCTACVACAIVNASASFNTVPNFNLPVISIITPPPLQVVFISVDLLPIIKPPMLN